MRALRALDRAVYRAERLAAAALFLLMALVMFASVLHRVFSREEGRLSTALLGLLRRFGAEPDPAVVHGPVAVALDFGLGWLVCYAMLRTMERERRFTHRESLLYGAGLTLLLAGATKLLLVVAPNGLVWGPVVALACMLWVAFLGASMATYEGRHLALEMGEKLWRGRALKVARALAWLSAAGVCVFLLALSVESIGLHHEGWAVNHLAGNLLPTPIPKWVVFLVFPYTFIVMTLRFLGRIGQAPAAEAGEEAA